MQEGNTKIMDDTDLRGLTPEAAKAYVGEFLTSLKLTDQELARLKEELATWTKRVELAAQKAATDLEAAARAKTAELASRLQQLEAERGELMANIQRMKEKLPMIAASQRLIDPDLLLAELQMASGEALDQTAASTTSRAIDSLGVEDALAALKHKLNSSGDGL